MVFSFFKKTPEKMVAKPAVVPRSTNTPETPVASDPAADLSVPEVSLAPPAATPVAEAAEAEFSDFDFSESAPEFQVEAEIDPVDAVAEEAAMLFANAQDAAARAVLENAVGVHRDAKAERLWLMLFDLYLLGGTRAPFDALGIEYARAFEKSPPGWRDRRTAPAPARRAEAAIPVLPFAGELLADNDAAFAELQAALAKHARLRLDLSKLARFDSPGCARLLAALQQARKARCEVELLGRDALAARLAARIEGGRAENQGCWLLYLELCQQQGRSAEFEEMAVNYAVTFEVSPPSWEARQTLAPEPPRAEAPGSAVARDDAGGGEAYALRGEIKAARFSDLAAHAAHRDLLLIDCAELVRIDFVSAGALLNVLTTVRYGGKPIVFRHPHHLVAELFAIVGLNAVASIVAEKY